MKKSFLLISILTFSQFSTMVFAQDPEWKLYMVGPDAVKYYWDSKNSYYKNGKVIVWTMQQSNTPLKMSGVEDFQGFTYDKSISKVIYPCDNTQYWSFRYSGVFYFKDVPVFGEASDSTRIPVQFTPGDGSDKFRNFLCTNLKPFWKLP